MTMQDPALTDFVAFLDGAREVPSVQEQKRIIFALLQLQPGQRTLDIGCGTGDDVRDMAQIVGSQGWCVGVDANGSMIEVARERSVGKNQPVEFQQGTIYTLTFADETFDVVRAERLFEHLSQSEQALAEMIRVTRPGGSILVASPDMDTWMMDHPHNSVTRRIRYFESDRRPNGPAGHRLYGLFHDAGLIDLQVRAVVHMATSYEDMLSFLDIKERAEATHDAGIITEDECREWLDQLDHAGRSGHFFMSTTHYIVCGRKPTLSFPQEPSALNNNIPPSRGYIS